MSQTALSVTAAFLPFHRISNCTKRWRRMLASNSRQFGAGLSSSRSDRRRIVAFNSTGPSGGVAEVSEGETVRQRFTWPDKKKPRVCILGGGFGGLYTALKLESLAWPDDKKPQVVLVDQSERFVFKPMLYELLSGEVDKWEIAPRFSDLLANTGVQFFQDRVKLLLPTDHLGMVGPTSTNCGGTVHLESGMSIEYDWLVLALGAEAKMDLVPGAAEFAFPFSTLDDASAVDSRLRTLEQINFGKDTLIRVAIVGCGYSGIELAATVSERLQDRGIVQAINVGTTILPNALPGNREVALKVLSSRKIELLLGYFVRCIRKAENVGDLEDPIENGSLQNVVPKRGTERYILELQPAEKGLHSQELETDMVLWTVGSKPPLLQLEASNDSHELPLNARGQTETDETLRVKGHPRIFALGDSSALRDSKGRLLPATAQVAFQQADFAAWNIWAAINDRPLLPFRFQNLGEMMTLGRHAAAVSPSFLEGLTLEGPLGHTARKLAYLLRLPTEEHQFKVGMSWLTKSAVDTVAQLQNTVAKVLSGS